MTAGRLDGQRAVVTGATGGIGFGIVQRFVSEGAAVLVAGVTDDEVDRAVTALRSEGARTVHGYAGDLSQERGGEQLRETAKRVLGGVDVLINNAGGGVIGATAGHSPETVRRTIDNNLWTTLHCTLAVLPGMVEQGYGRIVNIGAESVRNGLDGHAIYNAAKGGVHALATGLAREYAGSGVTVNVVAPSYTLTPEFQAALEQGSLTEELQQVLRRAQELIPMGRPARVEEVAAAVLFLASPEASFITGQVLSVNGGSSMG